MNGFIAGTVFIWPDGGNGWIQPPAVWGVLLGAGSLRLIPMWVCASHPGKPCFTVDGRKPFTGKRRRRLREFAPHARESLIPPLRGANLLPGRAAGGCEGLRPTPGKALFFRQGAQTNCREEAPAAVWVCASFPGKLYFTVEGRKPFTGKSPRRLCGFAPHSSESLIPPLRGANLLPGKAPGVCVSLRLTPRESLIPPLRGANRFPGSRRGVGAWNPARP